MAEKETDSKVVVVLKNGPNTPLIQPNKIAMPAHYKVGEIMAVLRERLQLPPEESLFVYVMQTFAASPMQDLHSLYKCYGSDRKLTLHYCKTEVWG